MGRRASDKPVKCEVKAAAAATELRQADLTVRLNLHCCGCCHLAQQRWAEIKTWLATKASLQYDVIALPVMHWNEMAEFDVEGFRCISSVHKGRDRAPKSKAEAGRTTQSQFESVDTSDGRIVGRLGL